MKKTIGLQTKSTADNAIEFHDGLLQKINLGTPKAKAKYQPTFREQMIKPKRLAMFEESPK